MALGLSTSWNAFRHHHARDLIFEIKALGFENVELSFNLTPGVVEEVAPLVRDGIIKVLSVHNFCPIPNGLSPEIALPDYYSLSSRDEQERKTALLFTKRTIETAARLGAKAVVLHTGRVQICDYTRELIGLAQIGRLGTQEYQRLRDRMIQERRENAGFYLDCVFKSLEELDRFAKIHGVAVGVETRFYYPEIPSFEEIGVILSRFKGGRIFYWHDTGHAQLMEDLGFVRHKDFLDAYASSLIGMHLHNIIGYQDHQAPANGEINFAFLARYVRPETLLIIEAHHPASIGQIRQGKELLESLGYGKTKA